MCRGEQWAKEQATLLRHLRCLGFFDLVKAITVRVEDGVWTPANPSVRGDWVAAHAILLRMLGGRTNQEWISQYSSSHQHPVNRLCHTLGIPTILLSAALFLASIFVHHLWIYALVLFLIGWAFQFIGHAFEGKPPEFFHDWRFLFVGVRWWWAKIHGRA